jgi:hypothetical protein
MTMAISERKRTCFVIMPFGEKKDLDGKDIDFDDIYRFFFKKAIEDLGIECIRCDEIEEAGSIHEKMFEHIYLADIVVVDITTSNANVYYELGIRHALAKGVTVLIRRKLNDDPVQHSGPPNRRIRSGQVREHRAGQGPHPPDHQEWPGP